MTILRIEKLQHQGRRRISHIVRQVLALSLIVAIGYQCVAWIFTLQVKEPGQPVTKARDSIIQDFSHANFDKNKLRPTKNAFLELSYKNEDISQEPSALTHRPRPMFTAKAPNSRIYGQLLTTEKEVPKHYVTVCVADGRRTGNLLFDYATLLSTGWRNNLEPVVAPDFPLKKEFDIKITMVYNVSKLMVGAKVYNEFKAGVYEPRLWNLTAIGYGNSNVSLFGYFQSWRYFQEYEYRLRGHFRFYEAEIKAAVKFFKGFLPNAKFMDGIIPKMQTSKATLVGIHVRRGDVFDQQRVELGFNFPEMSYFENAVKYFVNLYPNVHFVVCSDDIDWCKVNMNHLHARMTFSEGMTAIGDLAGLSMCEHVIMTTCTFGWWAGWLANGTTIYFDQWPRNGSKLQDIYNHSDFFMPHWIPMH